MHHTLNISQGCRPEGICMTIFTSRRNAPYWDQEVSPSVELDRHFHKFVPLDVVLFALTCILPDCNTPRRVRRSEGPFIAACGFNLCCYSILFIRIKPDWNWICDVCALHQTIALVHLLTTHHTSNTSVAT